MGWLGRVLGLGGDAALPEDPEIKALVASYLAEPGGDAWNVDVRKLAAGAALLALPPERMAAVIHSTLREDIDHRVSHSNSDGWKISNRREKLVSEICRRNLPLSVDEARTLCALYGDAHAGASWPRYKSLPKAITRAAQAGGWLASIRGDLEQVRKVFLKHASVADCRKAAKELELLIEEASGAPRRRFRLAHDAWGDKAMAALEAMDAPARERWQVVLDYCAGAKGSAPSGKWLAAGAEVIERFGKNAFAELACAWLALLREPTPKRGDARLGRLMVHEDNGDVLRGMAWLLVHVPEESVAAALADAAVAAFRKVPNFGARSVKAGNACLHALKSFPGLLGARQLAVLQTLVKQPSHAAAVEKALAECASRLNISVAETEELATPDHGFAHGRRTLQFGEASAELTMDGTSLAIAWRGADGKARKSEPAQIKAEFPDARKAMKRLVDDVDKTLTAVRDRLEHLPLELREWPLEIWQQRYFDHPLAGALARRLIWRFRGAREQAALWDGAQWIDEAGAAVAIEEGSTVLPWHPVFAGAESVRAWRALLAARGIVQPFKQAHREIYLLTEAERNTRVYSNRFAAHVLRQHQFASLCVARGWKYRLMGGFDSHNTPTLVLPRWNLCAEFWVDAPPQEGLTPAGIYVHVLTDQVRFRLLPRTDAQPARDLNEPLALEEVPPLVFSEVMRDVDLFVGVASIGADPTWSDGGPDGRFRTYWHDYSFGELSVAADNRKEIIAELLPRLALRERARIEGKFLVVEGKLRTYKIHLGSGNILMLPNDQYLCIVPDRSPRSPDVQLPFEGDALLAVILSKAFLLARDDEIRDSSITTQIRRGL